jgi:hypothetical protein
MVDNAETVGFEIVIGMTVIAPDGLAGVVRFIYESPEGPVAVVKLDDSHMRVIALRELALLPPPAHDSGGALEAPE